MKRKLFSRVIPALLTVAMLLTSAYATSYQSTDVAIGSSNQVTMVGEIAPTIMSVTMPSYVPFNIARSIEGENKVVSPRITMVNKSSVPVTLDVVYTSVDLSRLQGTSWSNNGQSISDNQIAIGFQLETIANQAPTSLAGTKWLQANVEQKLNITSMGAFGSSTMYVVGALGNAVPENTTFTVTPTFVVSLVQ